MLETIYGDTISSDPYDPQEVHLALGKSTNEMKVMWASMNELENSFVEYTLASVNVEKAISYTYTVPQNWYPIFAGLIYEVNVINLIPGKVQYKYRVGGYDGVNQTTRRSQDINFVSAPERNNPDQKNVFAMLGDQVC